MKFSTKDERKNNIFYDKYIFKNLFFQFFLLLSKNNKGS